MKKTLLSTALVLAMASTSGFAHHPAQDIVDEEIFAMIDENVSDIHAEMEFDDMGRDLTDAGGAGSMSGDMGADQGGEIADAGDIETREEMASMEISADRGEDANDSRGLQVR